MMLNGKFRRLYIYRQSFNKKKKNNQSNNYFIEIDGG